MVVPLNIYQALQLYVTIDMVQLKKKITLKTKHAEETLEANVEAKSKVTLKPKQPEEASEAIVEVKKSGNNKPLVAVLIVFVLAVLGYFLFNGDDTNDDSVVIDEIVVDEPHPENMLVTREGANTTQGVGSEKTQEDSANSPNTTKVNDAKDELPATESNNQSKDQVANIVVKKGNAQLETISSGLNPSTVEQKAKEVIRGDYGNGSERKQRLGSEYYIIQRRVNEMYKDGLVN